MMCVWRRNAARHNRYKAVKVVGRRASLHCRNNYTQTGTEWTVEVLLLKRRNSLEQ